MSNDSGKKTLVGCGVLVACVLAFILVVVVISGPVGIQNQFTAWKANAYGSDWLVIQYTGMGDVQHHWELKNAAVHNESHSDGIYFTTDHGVIHLSGHYIYIQNPTPEAKDRYLKHQPEIGKKK